MNLLAEEQKKLFEPGISDDERQKSKKCFWNYTIESVKSMKQVFW